MRIRLFGPNRVITCASVCRPLSPVTTRTRSALRARPLDSKHGRIGFNGNESEKGNHRDKASHQRSALPAVRCAQSLNTRTHLLFSHHTYSPLSFPLDTPPTT